MATERITHDDEVDALMTEERASIERALADSAAGRSYRLGPDDVEDLINLLDEEQARLRASREALDAWLAAHAAKYA